MWSNSVGAEVMKPIATPVLGGMVSSLLHVLIVTPVIFIWIRERRLGLHREPVAIAAGPAGIGTRRPVAYAAALLVVVLAGAAAWLLWDRGGDTASRTEARVVQTVPSGDLDIVLLSETGTLRQGPNRFVIEFRRTGTTTLVDVGTVHASASMAMPGMLMSGGVQVQATGVAGRYAATAEFGMAGAWQMAIEWEGAAGRGSVNFEGGVQ
jgi:Cu(I)/Ag(I) efflux system membrane protein CusA/SilA